MDRDWRFCLGDLETPLANKHIAAYMNNKAGWARGPARGPYDDSDWRTVDLPHDWSVEGPFSPENHLNAGYLPRGKAWYRRHFRLDEQDRKKRLILEFDGVSTFCTVYVNGHLLHRQFCGYTPFAVDFTDVAHYGDQLNTVAVKVDATYMEGWWYEGAGIYRHVYLHKKPFVHIDDIQVISHPTSQDQAEVVIRTTLVNKTDQDVQIFVRLNIESTITDNSVLTTISGSSTTTITQKLHLLNIQRWSVDRPHLYTLSAELYRPDQTLLDHFQTRFGIRTMRFDPQQGFFLNDNHLLLKGVCIHQDHAGVGVAVPDTIQRFRIQRLKQMGCNAIRPGHHPLAPEVMDACDELGILVLGENRNFGSSPEHLRQLEAMIRRDRNRPCVFAWCLCNEEPIQTTPIAKNIARTMAGHARQLDPTRPVTVAMSGGLLNDDSMADVVDIMGINYQLPQHDAFHEKHPNLPVFLSETNCTYATRGADRTDPVHHRFADQDAEHAPWGSTARTVWEHVQARSWIAGYFAWTGFDYRGEPSPHEWPSVLSHWGIMDLCGYPKQSYYLHRQWWTGQSDPKPELPSRLTLEIDPAFTSPILADGHCTVPIRVSKAGDNSRIRFEVTGPARIVGVGNGDPTSHEPERGSERKLFHGLAQVLVKTTDTPGEITITGYGPEVACLRFVSQAVGELNQVPPASVRYLIQEWLMSPIFSVRPDPAIVPEASDMNTWIRVSPGRSACQPFEKQSGYALYRATVKLPKKFQTTGAWLKLHGVAGEVEVYIADNRVDEQRGLYPIPPGASHSVVLLVQGRSGAGLKQAVEILPTDCAIS